MKISKLVDRLVELKAAHGDLEVSIPSNDGGFTDIGSVQYDLAEPRSKPEGDGFGGWKLIFIQE